MFQTYFFLIDNREATTGTKARVISAIEPCRTGCGDFFSQVMLYDTGEFEMGHRNGHKKTASALLFPFYI